GGRGAARGGGGRRGSGAGAPGRGAPRRGHGRGGHRRQGDRRRRSRNGHTDPPKTPHSDAPRAKSYAMLALLPRRSARPIPPKEEDSTHRGMRRPDRMVMG